jgi:hypothetical protein
MKRVLLCGALVLAALCAGGCMVMGASSGSSPGTPRCMSHPDPSGTQPLIYLFCVQTG